MANYLNSTFFLNRAKEALAMEGVEARITAELALFNALETFAAQVCRGRKDLELWIATRGLLRSAVKDFATNNKFGCIENIDKALASKFIAPYNKEKA